MEKTNLKRLNSVYKKNSIIILLILCMFILFGYFYSYNMVVPKYKSTSTILLASNDLNKDTNTVTQTEVNLNQNLISTYGKILKSKNVLGQVINNLNLEMKEEELYNNIEIKKLDDTQILQLSVISTNAYQSQKIAEELGNVFIEEIKQIYNMNNIKIVDKASLELNPYNVNHIKDIVISLILGIAFSSFIIAIIFILDTTVKIEQDIEEFVGLPVIGSVPKHKVKTRNELIVQNRSKSIISEALKTIRTNISFNDSNVILFTSCNAKEGKSWIAANMAVAYAQSNKNVIILDADMRKGRQNKIFHVQNTRGLSNCLKDIKNNEDYNTLEKYIQVTDVPKVHIMTIGPVPPNPSELLLSNKMKDLIHMLRCMYDIVIVDGTPCNLVSDSIPVSRIVDTTVLIAESRKTKIEDLKKVVKLIKNAQANIDGVILNKKEIKNKEYGKGYYYGKVEKKVNIEIKTNTVKELIENRKEYVEKVDEKEVAENTRMTILLEKIEELHNKFSEIPNSNMETYTNLVEDIKQIYEREIDKTKLAEEIKENIVKNDLIKKLEETNLENANVLEEKIQRLNYANELGEIFNKVNTIENIINNNDIKEKVSNLILEISEEQKLQGNKSLNHILQKIEMIQEEQNKTINELKIEQRKKSDELQRNQEKRLYELKIEQRRKIDELQENQDMKLYEMQEKQYKQIEELNDSEILYSIIKQIEDLKAEQEVQIEKLNQSMLLNNIISEMQKLNRKYEVVDNIEKIIKSANIEDKLSNMIEQMKRENEIKLEEIDTTKQVKEIMKELKNISTKYNQLTLAINEKNLSSKTTSKTNNVIELEKVKNKLNKKEISIDYGDEISYEELLDLSIGTYIIPSTQSDVRKSVEI